MLVSEESAADEREELAAIALALGARDVAGWSTAEKALATDLPTARRVTRCRGQHSSHDLSQKRRSLVALPAKLVQLRGKLG